MFEITGEICKEVLVIWVEFGFIQLLSLGLMFSEFQTFLTGYCYPRVLSNFKNARVFFNINIFILTNIFCNIHTIV